MSQETDGFNNTSRPCRACQLRSWGASARIVLSARPLERVSDYSAQVTPPPSHGGATPPSPRLALQLRSQPANVHGHPRPRVAGTQRDSPLWTRPFEHPSRSRGCPSPAPGTLACRQPGVAVLPVTAAVARMSGQQTGTAAGRRHRAPAPGLADRHRRASSDVPDLRVSSGETFLPCAPHATERGRGISAWGGAGGGLPLRACSFTPKGLEAPLPFLCPKSIGWPRGGSWAERPGSP